MWILNFILVLFLASLSLAKCFEDPTNVEFKRNYYRTTKYFIKGRVHNFTPLKPKAEELTTFGIEIIKIFKGQIKAKDLKVEYVWLPPFEGERLYKNGNIYIFGIKSISGYKALVDTNGCTPELTEKEILEFDKSK